MHCSVSCHTDYTHTHNVFFQTLCIGRPGMWASNNSCAWMNLYTACRWNQRPIMKTNSSFTYAVSQRLLGIRRPTVDEVIRSIRWMSGLSDEALVRDACLLKHTHTMCVCVCVCIVGPAYSRWVLTPCRCVDVYRQTFVENETRFSFHHHVANRTSF